MGIDSATGEGGEKSPIERGNDVRNNEAVARTDVFAAFNAVSNLPLSKSVLRTPQFLAAVNKVDLPFRENAVGLSLAYLLAHPDGYDFENFLETLPQHAYARQAEVIAPSIEKRLRVTRVTDEEKSYAVANYCKNQLLLNGRMMHAFNGSFADDVAREGLSANKRRWDWEELRVADQLCKAAGYETVFGSAFLNCEGKTSFTDTGSHLYSYAMCSPEWFGALCRGTRESRRLATFERRSKEEARQNIEELRQAMAHPTSSRYQAISLEQSEILVHIFEKYWPTFTASSEPKVALVNKRAILNTNDFDVRCEEWGQQVQDSGLPSNIIVGLTEMGDNIQITHSIEPKDISILDLPTREELGLS